MNNVFYDNEEQDTLLIPVEDEQYTVITDGNKDSVVAIDDTQQTETVLIPSAAQTLLAIDSGAAAPKQTAPVGDYVTIKTPQTITGNKDFTGELTHNGVPVATVEDFDTSNLVDLDSFQLIDGTKVFNGRFGVRNKSNGEINLIEYSGDEFSITENNGVDILAIDEKQQTMKLFNKKIATEEYVDAKAMEAGSGTVVHVGGVAKADIYFDEDPQTQLNNKVDTQYIDENLPIIVDNLVSNKGFIDKNVYNLAHYYDKDYIDNNIYDKTEVDQRIPTALSHLTDDVGYLTTEADPTVPDWAKEKNKPEYNYSEIKNTPKGVLSLVDTSTTNVITFDGTTDKTFTINTAGLEAEIGYNKDAIIELQNSVGNISDNVVELTGKVNNKVDTNTLKSYYTSSQTDTLLNDKATAAVTEAKGYTDTKISDLIGGAPGTLDTLKEIADAFAEDQEVLDALETAIGKKVDKVDGYGLSKNDYTDKDKTKLTNIAEGAEVNVQSDWTEKDTTSDAYIKNKPTIPDISGLASESYVNTTASNLQKQIDLKAAKEDLIDYATNEDLNKMSENLLNNIPDISGLASENYVQSVASVIHERIDGKQDTISDLATIRSGASAGATAVQPSTLESQVSTLQGKIDAKYTKPAGGIPASDLAETYDTVTSVNSKTTTTLNNAKSYTDTKIGELIGSAPETLDTLQEVAKAIKDNEDVVAGLNSAIGTKADKTKVDSLEVQVNTNAAAISNTYTKNEVSAILLGYATNNNLDSKVSKTTTINSKPLSSNITLSASDVGALPNTTVVPKLYNDLGENTDGAIDQATMTIFFNNMDEVFTGFENGLSSKYQKPSTGIPKTDLASDVQTSLGKADTALQSIPAEYVTETELNGKGYAKTTDLNNYLPLAGGDMTGGINYSYSGSSDYGKTELAVNNTSIISTEHIDASDIPTIINIGSTYSEINLRGKTTNPTYNDKDLALKSDVITKTSQLENDAGFITTAPEGVALYETTGSNTDGAMTQKATTDELNKKVSKGTTLVGGQLAQYTTSGTLETTGITPTDVMTLSTVQNVSGVKSFNANNHLIATCNSGYDATSKTASLTGFTSNHFTDGCEIYVQFVNGNTAGSRTSPVTLNVNSAGAKTMVVAESATLGSYNQNINLFGQWANNDVIKFRYDATYSYWVAVENVTQHKLYGFANTTLYSTTGTSETTGMTQKAITDALSGKANTSDIPDISNLATKDEIPDISGKADKVSGATEGNMAKLDADGNLVDSGILNSAIVVKSGTNTMSGTYVVTGTPRVKSTAQDVTTAPSSTQYKYIDFYDKNNSRVGLVGSQIRSDGYFGMYFQAENKASLGVLTNTTDYKLIATPLSKSVTNSGATKSYLTEALTGAGTLKIYHGTFTPSSGYCTITFAVPFTNASTISAFAEIRTIADSSAATAPRVSAISTTSVTFYSNRVKGTSSAVNDVAHSYFIIGY